MKHPPWSHWSFSARLILTAIIPVAVLFLAGIVYTYSSRISEVQEDLAERGVVIASAMAESSEYGLVSGNFSDLERIATSLVQADKTVSAIDILTADKRLIVHVTPKVQREAVDRVFEVPVKKQSIGVNEFQFDGLPHVSGEATDVQTTDTGIVGYVRVRMSPTELLAKQTKRLYVQTGISLLALFASTWCALYLARRLNKPIVTSIRALQQIRGGNFSVNVDVNEGGEIGDLLLSINEMSEALDEAKHQLEDKVLDRTNELEASRNEAVRANAEKRKLIQKVNSIVEDERKAISAEIHDELNAALIAMQLDLKRILNLTQTAEVHGDAVHEIREKAQSVINSASSLYARGRNLVRRLRPEVLDILGLHGAIEDIVNLYDKAHPSCQFILQSDGDFTQLDGETSIAAYRIVQETLSNVVKHSGATLVSVRMVLKQEDQENHAVEIAIADNGVGFDLQETTPGIGLIGIQERVHAFNGQLNVRTAINGGTTITIKLPVAINAQASK